MTSRRLDGTIGPDLVVQGTLDGKSDLRIEGVFEGKIDVEGTIHVGPEGSVTAPVRAASIEIEGELRGDVTASDRVAILPGGRLIGDVRARRIAVEDGGALQGGIEMDFDEPGGVRA